MTRRPTGATPIPFTLSPCARSERQSANVKRPDDDAAVTVASLRRTTSGDSCLRDTRPRSRGRASKGPPLPPSSRPDGVVSLPARTHRPVVAATPPKPPRGPRSGGDGGCEVDEDDALLLVRAYMFWTYNLQDQPYTGSGGFGVLLANRQLRTYCTYSSAISQKIVQASWSSRYSKYQVGVHQR